MSASSIRDIAIRLIHALLPTFAAGIWPTDTTQGYRACSRRYVMLPEVRPVGEISERCEMLAYLTMRASQTGPAGTELPVRRIFPDGGTVPTISAISGNAGLFRTLWATVTRRFHPSTDASDKCSMNPPKPGSKVK